MAEIGGVDTSSYPKAPALPAQKSVVEQMGQYQQLEQGNVNLQRSGIALGQDKLKQLNDQFNIMSSELATLANDPDATKETAASRLSTLAKTFGLKPEITNHMLGELKAAPDVKSFAQNALVRGMQTQEKVNNLYGTPGIYTNQQQDTPIVTSPLFGQRTTGAPIQRQIPPNQPVIGPDNKETLQGPTAPMAPPGIATGPGQRLPITNQPPQQPRPMLPVGKGNLINDGQVTGIEVQPSPNQVAQNRYPAPSGPVVGQSPLFEEGKKAYATAQINAGNKAQALKPLIQSIPLMQTPGFLSGPLTEQFTKVVAGLKSTGLIDIADNADPTAIRQEVVKKLNNYLSNSPVGQRSDAQQTLKEASSPSPNVQILPALLKLAKDQIALDRVEIIMPNSFSSKDANGKTIKDANGKTIPNKNYDEFLKHQGAFPTSVDEKALTLDQEPEEKSQKIVDDMAIKLKSKSNRERMQAEKFFNTLKLAKEHGIY